MKFLLPVLLVIICLPALAAAEPATKAAVEPPPEPGYEYFKPSDFFNPSVSPGAKFVGFIARIDGHTRLYRLDLATGKLEGVFDPGEGDISNFWWISDTRVLIKGFGSEGYVYFTYDLAGKKTLVLPTLGNPRSSEVQFYSGLKEQVVVSQPEYTKVLRNDSFRSNYLASIDLNTGREKRLGSYHGSVDNTVLSASGELRAEAWMQGATWHVRWRESAKSPWQEIEGENSWPAFVPLAMAADDRQLLVIAYDQGDAAILMRLDPATGQRTPVLQKPGRDFTQGFTQKDTANLTAVLFYDPVREDAFYVDPALADLQRKLQRSLPGENTRLLSQSADLKTAVVANWDSGHPSTFYLLANGRLSLLGQQHDALKVGALGRTREFSFTTRDGLVEAGYVTVPANATGPLPLLMLTPRFIGETAPSGCFYDAETQYYVSRGYAVAQVITRGQHGLGRKFESAGDLKLSDRVLEDLEDGLRHLIAEKIADPAHVSLYGYGDQALLALYAGRLNQLFHAIVVEDPGEAPNANDIGWQSSRRMRISNLVNEAGGVDSAYQLMRKLDPESTVPLLQVPVLLAGVRTRDASTVEDLLKKQGKTFQSALTKWEFGDWRYKRLAEQKQRLIDFRVARSIADFLDARLKAPAP